MTLKPTRLVSSLALSLALTAGAVPTLSAAQTRSAGAAAPAPLAPADKALVDRATAYLQNLSGARGRFTQTDPNGAVSTGTFYLQRPGKIRFEYDPKRPLLVVSDGHNVKIYDRALKTFDQYPLGSTPLSLILAKEVRLDKGVVVERVERRPAGFSITVRDGKKQAEGRMIATFSDGPMRLTEWTVIDPRGQRTRVQLAGLTEVASLDPKLFQLRDPTQRPGRGR
jgi:outer membrane lipoprotein-sorting protein